MHMQYFQRKQLYILPKTAKQAGFTLLLAALVASIVISLGAAIFQVARKQVLLSGIGRDSQFAFYAADTAAECALYWDFRHSLFASTTPSLAPAPSCDGRPMNIPVTTNAPYPYTKTSAQMALFINAANPTGYCATVRVLKCQGVIQQSTGTCTPGSTTDPIQTLIHADGYSVGCASIATSPRALQRSIELRY